MRKFLRLLDLWETSDLDGYVGDLGYPSVMTVDRVFP